MDIRTFSMDRADTHWLIGFFNRKDIEPSTCDCECGECITEPVSEKELWEYHQKGRFGRLANYAPASRVRFNATVKLLIERHKLKPDDLLLATTNKSQEKSRDYLVMLGFECSEMFYGNGGSELHILKARVKDLKLED